MRLLDEFLQQWAATHENAPSGLPDRASEPETLELVAQSFGQAKDNGPAVKGFTAPGAAVGKAGLQFRICGAELLHQLHIRWRVPPGYLSSYLRGSMYCTRLIDEDRAINGRLGTASEKLEIERT